MRCDSSLLHAGAHVGNACLYHRKPLRPNDLGDLLTTTPAFAALRRRFPSSRIVAAVARYEALAGGLAGGILTVLSLVYNGLSLGIGFGVFANHHAAGYLATFIAGHGVLELTAIFISGGAGLRLAQALVAPGDLTRKDALVLQGAVALRMIGAVVCLLVVAGAIEGLLSASDAPPAYKFAVSALSGVLLACYFASGRAYLRSQASAAATAVAASGATGTTPR